MARHRKTRRRYNDPGHAHFLTFSCFRRMPLFSKERPRLWFAEAWNLAAAKHDVDLWAYVLMPDHAHLLVCPRRQEYSISALLKTLKPSVTSKAVFWLRANQPAFLERLCDRQPNGQVSYRFWQRGGGHDLNLWDARRIWNHIDYLHDNPTRRGPLPLGDGLAMVERIGLRRLGARTDPVESRTPAARSALHPPRLDKQILSGRLREKSACFPRREAWHPA